MKSIAINWIHIHFLVCIRINPYSARKFSLPGLFNEKRWAKEKFSFIGLSELTKHNPFLYRPTNAACSVLESYSRPVFWFFR